MADKLSSEEIQELEARIIRVLSSSDFEGPWSPTSRRIFQDGVISAYKDDKAMRADLYVYNGGRTQTSIYRTAYYKSFETGAVEITIYSKRLLLYLRQLMVLDDLADA